VNPQDIKAADPELPEVPEEPVAAANAEETGRVVAEDEQEEGEGTQMTSVELDERSDTQEEEEEDEDEESHWVSIELQDEEGNPVVNEPFEIKLPDGSIRRGRTDEEGKARYEDLAQAGECEVRFPRLDGGDWKEA
jgi:hypothetical protein